MLIIKNFFFIFIFISILINNSFSQKSNFENFKKSVPQPVIDKCPECINIYWIAWKNIYSKLKNEIKKSDDLISFIEKISSEDKNNAYLSSPIKNLIKDVLGFEVSSINDSIYWKIDRVDRHGINNLRFRDIQTSIIAKKRSGNIYPCSVTVKSNKDYKLSIKIFDTLFRKKIKKGTNEFILVLE